MRACVYTDICACMCIHRHICVHLRTYARMQAYVCTRKLRPNGAHLHSTTALRTHPVRREAHKLPNVIQLAVAYACTHAYITFVKKFDISRCELLSRAICFETGGRVRAARQRAAGLHHLHVHVGAPRQALKRAIARREQNSYQNCRTGCARGPRKRCRRP